MRLNDHSQPGGEAVHIREVRHDVHGVVDLVIAEANLAQRVMVSAGTEARGQRDNNGPLHQRLVPL